MSYRVTSAGKSVETIYLKGIGTDPFGLECGPSGELFVTRGHRIVRVSASGQAEFWAGGHQSGNATGHRLQASFDGPRGLCWSSQNMLLICLRLQHTICAISGNDVSTYARTSVRGWQDGPKSEATFSVPTDLVELSGYIYIADSDNHCIRAINMASGMVTSIGSGTTRSLDGDLKSGSFHIHYGICAHPTLFFLWISSPILTS